MSKTFVICSILLLLINFSSNRDLEEECGLSNELLLVNTPFGKIRGITTKHKDICVKAFLGIPYAKPPIGHLRFELPEEFFWNDVLEAKQMKNYCSQPGHLSSEDCLYLNIWVPFVKQKKPLTTMIFIHGGSFFFGSSSNALYDSTTLSAISKNIIVSLNYRLGFFGFAVTNTTNVGLYDQYFAIKWIHENIHLFGGDSSSITIFGHSAGSISLGAHILSPLTRPLFKRAIMQSGTPYSPVRPESIQIGINKVDKLAKWIGCRPYKSSENFISPLSSEEIACLKNVKSEKIIEYENGELVHSPKLPNPIYGDKFLPNNAFISRSHKWKNDIDLLIGFNQDEGNGFVIEKYPNFTNFLNTKDDAIKLMKALMYDKPFTSLPFENYLKNLEDYDNDALKNAVFRFYGDVYVNCPTYFYAYSYDGNYYTYMLNYKASIPLDSKAEGIVHGEELAFIFALPLRKIGYSENDIKMSYSMINIWSQFAKTGKIHLSSSNRYEKDKYFILEPQGIEKKSNERFKNCEEYYRHHFEDLMKE